jgi:glycosyltransferase involved in cell wall biosynthesis
VTVSILGTFGASTRYIRGPHRVAQSLARALLDRGDLDLNLYEMVVPKPRLARFYERRSLRAQIPGLVDIHCLTPRAIVDAVRTTDGVVHFLGTLGFYSLPLLYHLRRHKRATVATLNGLYRVEREYGYPYTWLDIWAEAIGLRYVSQVVAVSAGFKDVVEAVYPISRGKTVAIEHGVPPFALAEPRHGANTREGGLCAGGTDRVKGIPFLLQAINSGSTGGSAWRLTLAGRAGSEHGRVLNAATALGSRFHYVGEVPTTTLAELYERCRFYVQPSAYEPFGMAVLEAMALGAPVIVTRKCGTANLIRDGENGFVVEYGDVAALGTRMEQLASDGPLARRLGEQARVTARACTWERAAGRYAELYRN